MSRPRSDSLSPWLGGRPFRIALVLFLLVLAASVLIKRASIRSMQDKVVPAVTLLGADKPEVGRPETYRVLVFNALDGSPLPHADVRLGCVREARDEATDEWRLIAPTVAGGPTDRNGQATFEVVLPAACGPLGAERAGSATMFAEVSALGTEHGASILLQGQASGTAAATLLVTDKPIYQPGQVVRARALFLGQDHRPLPNAKVTFQVIDPKGNKVLRRTLTTSPFGNVHADFPLADQVNLGDYSISVGAGKVGARQTIEVKRYTLPKFDVQVDPVAKVVEPGKTLRVTARAKWMFDEPVAGAAVDVWITPRGDTGYPAKLNAKTNASGEFSTDVQTPNDVGDFDLRAKVELEGETRTVSVPIVVSRSSFNVELVPDGGPLVAGITNDAYLLASHADGAPARVRVSIEPDGPTVDTSASGIARISFIPSGDQKLHARQLDGTGNDEVFSLPELGSSAGVIVRSERVRYFPNDVIRVAVNAALDDVGTVYLDAAKGQRVLAVGTCRLSAGACETSLHLPADVSGLVRVRALRMKGQDKAFASRFVLVGTSENLAIGVRSDKPTYAPAETAILDFEVTRGDGQPVPAALSLAGVDEAVFALAESRPDLQMFFLGVGRDLLEEGSVGRTQGRYGRYRQRRLLEPASALLRDRSEELLSTAQVSADESQRAMLVALAAAAPVPEGLDFVLADKVRSGAWGWQDAEEAVWARVVVVPGLLFLVVSMVLVAYGLRRLRRGKINKVLMEDDIAIWRKVSRGLLSAWVLTMTIPWLFIFASTFVAEEILRIHGEALLHAVAAQIAVIVIAFTVLQVRALMRVRRTRVGAALKGLSQAGWLLPTAGILFYAALFVPTFAGKGYVRHYLASEEVVAAFVMLVLGAQLVFGALSLIRNTADQETSMRRGVWLLLSRATFLGLPISLIVLGVAVSRFSPHDTGPYEQIEEEWADTKEGGTGTRAKGEEGSMGAPSGDGQSGPPKARVRTQFPETLLWAPEVVTDERGHARVPVPLADSITTWRLSASAISSSGGMGTATTGIRVMQDFFGDVTLPGTLTQKDEIAVPVTVFNYLDGPQKVKVTLELEAGLGVMGGADRALTLGANEVRTVSFRVRAEQPGVHRVRVHLVGTELSDALEREVRVEPDGYRVEQTFNGVLPATPRTTAQLPKGAIKGGSDLYVKIYGGLVSQLAESLDGSFHRPHGCFEQTSSTTYPNVLLLDYLRRVKRSSPAVEAKAIDYIGIGYQRLISYEVDGGGFSLFGAAPASTVMSAYGLMEFHDMSKVYDVDPEVMKRTRDWLYTQQKADGAWTAPAYGASNLRTREPEWIRTTSYVAWAIAMTGDKDPRLQRALDLVSGGDAGGANEPYTVALRANALAAGGRAERAKQLLQGIVDKGERDASGLHWSTADEGITWSRGSAMNVELTALMVQAMAAVDAWPAERAAASSWIANQRGSHGTWYSTQSTVAALRALLAGAKPVQSGDQQVDVFVNGKPAGHVDLPEKERDLLRQLSLREHLGEGDNVVEVRSASEDLLYQVVAVHYMPWAKAPAVPKEAPMALEVKYGATTVKVGQTVSCEARVGWSRAAPVQMPMLELGVPPGFEAEREDFEKLVQEGRISRYGMSDRKVVVYLDELTRDAPKQVSYRLRAVRPARAVVPASVAYPYYEPEVGATAQPVVLTSE